MRRIESQPLLQLSQDDGPSLGVLLFLASALWQEAEDICVSPGRANRLLFLSLLRELIPRSLVSTQDLSRGSSDIIIRGGSFYRKGVKSKSQLCPREARG